MIVGVTVENMNELLTGWAVDIILMGSHYILSLTSFYKLQLATVSYM